MFLLLHLNSRLQPKHRFELEDALTAIFEKNDNVGEVIGGGTQMEPSGEILSCDIELEFSDSQSDFNWLLDLCNHIGIPKGSSLEKEGEKFPVGSLEGLGLYLDGQNLAQEVYENNDINELIAQIEDALGDAGRLYSWRELNDTALYYYGVAFDIMNEKITSITKSSPLCENCRIIKIA